MGDAWFCAALFLGALLKTDRADARGVRSASKAAIVLVASWLNVLHKSTALQKA